MRARFVATPLLSIWATTLGAQGGGGANTAQPNRSLHSIVGRVTDANGQPVVDVFITALRPDPARRYVMVSALLHTETDGRGQFRLDGMAQGDYYVVALPRNPAVVSQSMDRSGLANTFYPSSIDVDHAQKVNVAGLGPVTANIVLQPAHLATVSGIVTGSNGQTLAAPYVEIAHGDGFFGLDSRRVRLRPDGTFVAPGLQPGTYFFVVHESAWPPSRGVMPLVSQAKVLVNGQDTSDVRVRTIRLVSVTGRFTAALADRSALKPSAMNVSALPENFDGNPGPRLPATIRDDLSFEFETWPGTGKFRVTVPTAFLVKAVRLNGVDVTDKYIEFSEGQRIAAVEIELVRRGSLLPVGIPTRF